LPASDTLLCQYLEWQIGSVDPKNLGGYLSAIRNLHLSLGLPWVRRIQGSSHRSVGYKGYEEVDKYS
jgi:hypothetical protein